MKREASDLLGEADLDALLETVQRFANRSLAPATAKPELALPHGMSRSLLGQLEQMGVLNSGAEPACGLWDDPDDPVQRLFAAEALRILAAHSPGFAYQAHLRGLANFLNRLYRHEAGDCVVCFDGRLGLGRHALVRALAGQPLSSEQAAQLADCWALPVPEAPRLLHAMPDWQAVWMMLWHPEQGFRWQRFERAAVAVQVHANGHGFDELESQSLSFSSPPQYGVEGPHDAIASRRNCMLVNALHGLGLLAIASGGAGRGIKLATEFSKTRRQGRHLIGEHVAVQQLLCEGNNALWMAEGCLQRLCRLEPSLPMLAQVWRARTQLHPMLCVAASNAVQVFGGIGYMRDNGVEKLLRDCNQLRLLAGSPVELTLCCAEWERLQ